MDRSGRWRGSRRGDHLHRWCALARTRERPVYGLKKNGDKAVIHGLRGKPSKRRIEESIEQEAVKILAPPPAKPARTRPATPRQGSDWNKDFELKKAPKICQSPGLQTTGKQPDDRALRFQGMAESTAPMCRPIQPGPKHRFPVGSGPDSKAGRKITRLPIVAMSSDRLFLNGLLARIARLRFTGRRTLTRIPITSRQKGTFLLCLDSAVKWN